MSAPRGGLQVAVIGAGAAGLVAARELLRRGHSVVVIEQDPDLGGVWRYDPCEDDDPFDQSEVRREVHSSMYASLRTNLPREVMGYADFPFTFPLPTDPKDLEPSDGADPRRFPGHAEVLRYLRHFARAFDIERHVQYGTKVVDVSLLHPHPSGAPGLSSTAGLPQPLLPHPPHAAAEEASPAAERQSGTPAAHTKFVVRTQRMTAQRVKVLAAAGQGTDGSKVPELPGQQDGLMGDKQPGLLAQPSPSSSSSSFVADAVVVCNGHYALARLALIPGMERWPGQQMHSHNYRSPEMFKDKVVVLLGAGSSGDDLSKEISGVAKAVYMTSRKWTSAANTPQPMLNQWPRLCYHPMVTCAHADGSIEFGDGSCVVADVIFHCTGYKYSFPFLRNLPAGVVSVESNRVGPLFRHVFPPALAPHLSFIGLPWKVVPFPLMELQAKWVALLLSPSAPQAARQLPSAKEMLADVHHYYRALDAHGVPQDYTHCLSFPELPLGDQFEYDDWLAQQCGCLPLPQWRRVMYSKCSQRKRLLPWAYRDTFDDEDALACALAEFKACAENLAGKATIEEVSGKTT